MTVEPVVVIGGGPAGIAASVQLARHGYRPILFEQNQLGGLLRNANLVENYPGFPGGISGEELADIFERQLEGRNIKVLHEEVSSLDFRDDSFVITAASTPVRARAVVVASGTRPVLHPELSSDPNLAGKVFYEVYPIGMERDKTVAIIGAGDAAFDYALTLARANSVHILNRGTAKKCIPALTEKVEKASSIYYKEKTEITGWSVRGDGRVVLSITCEKGREELVVDYVLPAIGRQPRRDFLSAQLVESSEKLQAEERLHFAGDVNGGRFRQTGIAVGQGIMAAMQTSRFLDEGEAK